MSLALLLLYSVFSNNKTSGIKLVSLYSTIVTQVHQKKKLGPATHFDPVLASNVVDNREEFYFVFLSSRIQISVSILVVLWFFMIFVIPPYKSWDDAPN